MHQSRFRHNANSSSCIIAAIVLYDGEMMRVCLTVCFGLMVVACGPSDVDGDGDGYSAKTDCDDTAQNVHPGADEICDGVDNDCNGLIDDDAVDRLTLFVDSDGDTFGDPDTEVTRCEPQEDEVEDNTDCDDTREDVYPGAMEFCDDLQTDENCDGLSEDDAPDNDESSKTLFFPDVDRDLYGDATHSGTTYCDDPSDDDNWFTTDNSDCDDGRDDVNPAAEEICDASVDSCF